jgi:WD40 repeat protein
MEHKRTILTTGFSSDGRLLLTAGGDLNAKNDGARVWDAATGRPAGGPFNHPAEHVLAAAFSPDASLLLTAGDDSTARLWDVQTGALHGEPLLHHGPVEAVAFSPDGKTVATASNDRTARLWDVATGKLRAPPLAHPAALQAVAFSPDGTLLATGGRDDAARLWDVATGKPMGTPMRHKTAVRFLAFDPGGKTLLTSGFETTAADRTVRLWTVPAPLPGDGERLALWAQVLTGMELDSQGAVSALEPEEWQQRRRQLEQLGGAVGP